MNLINIFFGEGRLSRMLAAVAPSLFGVLTGVLAIWITLYPPTESKRSWWVEATVTLSVLTFLAAVWQAVREDLKRGIENEDRNRRTQQDQQNQELFAKMERNLALYSPKSGLAARAGLVASQLESFIQRNGATWASRPRFHRPAALIIAMGGGHLNYFPDQIIAQNYDSEFGQRMQELVPKLRQAGVQLHYPDGYYVHAPKFLVANYLNSIVIELRDAANTLASSAESQP